jgi:phospholipid/cholesterol/gamma-HCH transport system substrate-binding protein
MTGQQRRRAVALLLFMGVCFAIFAYYLKLAGTNLIPGASPYTVEAMVPNSVSLAPAADVREQGVNVGRVDRIAAGGPGGVDTLLKLEIDSHAPIYRDAQVYIRAKSVAGENYVEIDPGTPQAGAVPSGGLLGIDHAQDATQLDQLLSIFDAPRRQDVQRALGGLSAGLSDGGRDLSRTLESASALPGAGSSATQVMSSDRAQLARLIDSFGVVAQALGERRAAIQLFTRQVESTAQAVAQRDAALRATLKQLPPFLRQARETAGRLQRFASGATPVVRNLRLAAEDLVPTVNVLLPAAREGQATVRALGAFAQAVTPAVRELQPFAAAATGFVPPLEGFLREAKPMVTYLAPYYREVSSFFADDAASFQASDALGHVARVVAPISRSDAAGLLTPQEDQLLQKLDAPFDTRGTNAYPAPGQASSGAPLTGAYPRIQADPPYGVGNHG